MSTPRSFNVGDTVLVDGSDMFQEKETPGEIVECGVGNFLVRLGADLQRSYSNILRTREMWFPLAKLSKYRWPSSQDRATFLFGRYAWTRIYVASFPWSAENICMHNAHDGFTPPLAARRCLVHCFSAVHEMDFCEAHLHFDGQQMDVPPKGKRWLLSA